MIYSPQTLSRIPQTPGVYKFKDIDEKIIYIGKAVNLKNRVSSYFNSGLFLEKNKKIALYTRKIEIIQVRSEFEALLLEARLIKKCKPRYNVITRDGRSYIYILITLDDFPRVLISPKTLQKGNIFGPFSSARTVRKILIFLRSIFPFCTQKPPLKRVCFYHHLNLCSPCPGEIIKAPDNMKSGLTEKYQQNIINIKKVLSGKSNRVISDLTSQMTALSKNKEFEKAAALRDTIAQLNYLKNSRGFNVENYLTDPGYALKEWKKEQRELEKILDPHLAVSSRLNTLECYDISNLTGKFATGSMVTFYQGTPDKNRYRHFRIRNLDTPDDYEMLKQVFHRRFKHKNWPLPDLFLVDGGQLQLAVILKALTYFKINIPAISLAKKHEEIYLRSRSGFIKMRLPPSSPAVLLLRRIRDEAHRFAHSYHSKLRMKFLLGLLHN